MVEKKILEIDGSFGEGGGSIIRLSAAFSILFNQPIKIKNIRANRPNPGLRLQHLLGLKTLANLTGSLLSECKIGTTELSFTPKKEVKNSIKLNVNTAASLGLLIQPLQIACLGFTTPDKINVSLNGGGTFGKWAPSLNYLQKVTFSLFRKSGLEIEIFIKKHGWYPKGGANVDCIFYPPKQKLKPLNLTELGNIDLIEGEIVLTHHLRKSKSNICERIKKSINRRIREKCKVDTSMKCLWVPSISPGVGVSLWAKSDTGAIISSGTILGEKQISSEKLGEFAANELITYIQNDIPVDNYLSDQLIPLMAYTKEPSKIRVLKVTNHTNTNLRLINKFLDRKYRITKENTGYIIEYQY
ncbi:MAG: RNA 3'-terminal phosphate cyclase [Promethearchaeota archaeon]